MTSRFGLQLDTSCRTQLSESNYTSFWLSRRKAYDKYTINRTSWKQRLRLGLHTAAANDISSGLRLHAPEWSSIRLADIKFVQSRTCSTQEFEIEDDDLSEDGAAKFLTTGCRSSTGLEFIGDGDLLHYLPTSQHLNTTCKITYSAHADCHSRRHCAGNLLLGTAMPYAATS